MFQNKSCLVYDSVNQNEKIYAIESNKRKLAEAKAIAENELKQQQQQQMKSNEQNKQKKLKKTNSAAESEKESTAAQQVNSFLIELLKKFKNIIL